MKLNGVEVIREGKLSYFKTWNEATRRRTEDGYFHTDHNQCPFGERDLLNDECYSGNGVNRCKYFVRYDWNKHSGCVACSHPVPEKKCVQLELF